MSERTYGHGPGFDGATYYSTSDTIEYLDHESVEEALEDLIDVGRVNRSGRATTRDRGADVIAERMASECARCSRSWPAHWPGEKAPRCKRDAMLDLEGHSYCVVCFQELRLAGEHGSPTGQHSGGGLRTVVVTADYLESLLEYSTSIPTGTAPGKTWKRRTASGWVIGRYEELLGSTTEIEIWWFRAVTLEELAGVALWNMLNAAVRAIVGQVQP